MVEVFKTNVNNSSHAKSLIREIHLAFSGYRANFDLEDCDRILRVECNIGTVDSSLVIDILKAYGFDAEILPDEDFQDTELFFRGVKF